MTSPTVTPVPLDVVQGAPVQLTIAVDNATADYPAGYQLYGQVRTHARGPLLLDLTGYLTAQAGTDDDVTVTLHLSGAITRTLRGSGYYWIWLAEPGTGQDHARLLRTGPLRLTRTGGATSGQVLGPAGGNLDGGGPADLPTRFLDGGTPAGDQPPTYDGGTVPA